MPRDQDNNPTIRDTGPFSSWLDSTDNSSWVVDEVDVTIRADGVHRPDTDDGPNEDMKVYKCRRCGRKHTAGSTGRPRGGCPRPGCDGPSAATRPATDDDYMTGSDCRASLYTEDIIDTIDEVAAGNVVWNDDRGALQWLVNHVSGEAPDSVPEDEITEGVIEYIARTRFTHIDDP